MSLVKVYLNQVCTSHFIISKTKEDSLRERTGTTFGSKEFHLYFVTIDVSSFDFLT